MIKDHKLINTRPDWAQIHRRQRVWDALEPWIMILALVALNALCCWIIGN